MKREDGARGGSKPLVDLNCEFEASFETRENSEISSDRVLQSSSKLSTEFIAGRGRVGRPWTWELAVRVKPRQSEP